MKKITQITLSLVLLISLNSCVGYKPIFSSSNLKFEISNYSLKGDKKIGQKIYYKLFKSSSNDKNSKNIYISINSSKSKTASVKNSKGKIIEYKIDLVVNILVKDFYDDIVIFNQNFASSSTYKVQDQYSETINLENKTLKDLINKIFQDILIKMSENILVE